MSRQFRSEGINGYVGKRNVGPRRPQGKFARRKLRRRLRQNRKIVRIIDNANRLKNVYTLLTQQQCVEAPGAGNIGFQQFATLAMRLDGQVVAGIQAQINTLYSASANITSYDVDTWVFQCMMKNQAQTNAIVDLYEIRPRVSTHIDPSTNITSLASQSSGYVANDELQWGWTPFQCPAFCEMYKIIRKMRYLLAPGATEMVEIRKTLRKHVELARFYGVTDATPASGWQDPKYTTVFLACVRGEPENDSVVTTDVNTSTYKVDFIMREDYHFTYDPSNLKHLEKKVDNRSTFPNAEQIILIDTGAKVTPPVQA